MMPAHHLPANMIALARHAVRHPDTAPAQLVEAATLLRHSPHADDQLVARTLLPDMAQIQPDDPPQRLEPGGRLGTVAVMSIAFLALTAVALLGALAVDAPATLSFITFGRLP